jgi:N-methylhydantoinase A
MEFEVELETTRDHTTGFITDARGRKEEITVKPAQDSLISLITCIEEGSRRYGYSAKDLLERTKRVILRSPEIITDTLEKREGARIGLVVSKGQEKKVYFKGNRENPAIGFIVAKEMIVGIDGKISAEGEQVLKPREEEVKDKVRYLLEFGAGIIVVSLLNAALNPANERLVKEIIESDYPRHYLGAVPVLVASDFSDERNNFLRTTVCLVNAYTWFNLNDYLRRAESFLQKNGYNYSLLVGYTDGGTAHINRVTPLKTCVSDHIAFIKSMYG